MKKGSSGEKVVLLIQGEKENRRKGSGYVKFGRERVNGKLVENGSEDFQNEKQ